MAVKGIGDGDGCCNTIMGFAIQSLERQGCEVFGESCQYFLCRVRRVMSQGSCCCRMVHVLFLEQESVALSEFVSRSGFHF